MSNSETHVGSGATTTTANAFRLDEMIRSEALVELNDLCSRFPVFQQVIDKPLQIRLVLDANIVQRELRWRLRSRRKQDARSALHEVIESGTVVPFAPSTLDQEIEDHVSDIAKYAGVGEDRVREEWMKFRSLIHIYEPQGSSITADDIDPDDTPYKQACIELGAHAVYTKDPHFKSMDVPLIEFDIDRVFRKYARASSIKLGFTIGSGFTLTISLNVLKELLKFSVRSIQRIPTPLKIALASGMAVALIHPRSRAKMIEVGKNLWNKLTNPQFMAILSSLVVQLAEAQEDAETARKSIEAALPKTRKRSALAHAREICLIEKQPITVPAIEARMKHAGYVTRSRNFANYLRRVLRANRAFIETSPGKWTLKAAA